MPRIRWPSNSSIAYQFFGFGGDSWVGSGCNCFARVRWAVYGFQKTNQSNGELPTFKEFLVRVVNNPRRESYTWVAGSSHAN
ncbi:hypothetical protein N7508_000389 [Penicillium antarcticum]|uniref:uncharacterized protein n=1 Tax=Penicillium antarcticum TaxID=416450 RepID=UPI00239C3381|nr:uncharacterized protein N7508_000389 [Penicillium antarcticum]KAJ5320106.1 hypothetical protein N7508_000389 [Penicillium antarcticum]